MRFRKRECVCEWSSRGSENWEWRFRSLRKFWNEWSQGKERAEHLERKFCSDSERLQVTPSIFTLFIFFSFFLSLFQFFSTLTKIPKGVKMIFSRLLSQKFLNCNKITIMTPPWLRHSLRSSSSRFHPLANSQIMQMRIIDRRKKYMEWERGKEVSR